MADLETVTLTGVEILSTGGPVHGVGSPPEGDYWTTDQLRAMAEAAQELEAGGEWRIPAKIGAEPLGKNKIGHDRRQTLLSTGELPAAGWLSNQRVSEDGTKLLADIADVPRKIADLVKARAYRTRSSELGSVTSQRTGKRYDWVVTGLAWLGGRMPAVRTLDDIVALYEGDETERKFVQMDDVEPDVDALRDYIASLGTTFLEEAQAVLVARVEPRLMELTLTDEQAAALREKLAMDAATELTPEALTAAAETRANEAATKIAELEAKVSEADSRKNESTELATTVKKLEADLKVEQTRRFESERDADIKEALRTRIEPADKEKWEKRYETLGVEVAREMLFELPQRENVREFGSDDDGREDDADFTKQYEADIARSVGIPVEELI